MIDFIKKHGAALNYSEIERRASLPSGAIRDAVRRGKIPKHVEYLFFVELEKIINDTANFLQNKSSSI